MKALSAIIVCMLLRLNSAQFVQWYHSSAVPGAQFYNNVPQVLPASPSQYYNAIPQQSFFYQTRQQQFRPQFYQTNQVLQHQYVQHQPIITAPTAQLYSQVSQVNRPQYTATTQAPAPDNYRGFGYHTAYNDGASATVVFFRGAPNVQKSNAKLERITVASDDLDPQTSQNIQKRIEQLFEAQNNKTATKSTSPDIPANFNPIVRALFEQPQMLNSGVVHFYSGSTLPAGTTLLPRGRALSITENEKKENNQEQEPAESIVTVSKINNIIEDRYMKAVGQATVEPKANISTTPTTIVESTSSVTSVTEESTESLATTTPMDNTTTPVSTINETTNEMTTIADDAIIVDSPESTTTITETEPSTQ